MLELAPAAGDADIIKANMDRLGLLIAKGQEQRVENDAQPVDGWRGFDSFEGSRRRASVLRPRRGALRSETA